VMNWEPFPQERIVGPLGVPDPEVGVLRFIESDGEGKTIATIFNHADHPNTLSGDSFLISAEYPGFASRLIREHWGGEALFLNGAQGSIDIDNFKDRGLPGLERNGRALAEAVGKAIACATPIEYARLALRSSSYTVPARHITPKERSWAEDILASTKGEVHPMADGVGDDYTANLYMRLQKIEDTPLQVEQLCFAFGDCAFVSFPGELYTEIGLAIKAKSAFPHTYVIGLANGSIGYVPTRKAIAEGGYSEVTREVDDSAEEIVLERSLSLLQKVHKARSA
jgi:neutral ceramidase